MRRRRSSSNTERAKNSEKGRIFYDITGIKEISGTNGKYVAPLARSSSASGDFAANVAQSSDDVKPQNASSIGVDTDNPIYQAGIEEADYGEALPDGYSEYDIVQEMLSDARGTMNDFKGNTKLKAELDEEVRQQLGERRTGTGERRTALSRASRRSEPNFRQNNKNGVFLPRKW